MVNEEGISIDTFRVLADRAGLGLTDQELEELKPMFDHFARQTAVLNDLDLDAEDLAVRFPPEWDFSAPTQPA